MRAGAKAREMSPRGDRRAEATIRTSRALGGRTDMEHDFLTPRRGHVPSLRQGELPVGTPGPLHLRTPGPQDRQAHPPSADPVLRASEKRAALRSGSLRARLAEAATSGHFPQRDEDVRLGVGRGAALSSDDSPPPQRCAARGTLQHAREVPSSNALISPRYPLHRAQPARPGHLQGQGPSRRSAMVRPRLESPITSSGLVSTPVVTIQNDALSFRAGTLASSRCLRTRLPSGAWPKGPWLRGNVPNRRASVSLRLRPVEHQRRPRLPSGSGARHFRQSGCPSPRQRHALVAQEGQVPPVAQQTYSQTDDRHLDRWCHHEQEADRERGGHCSGVRGPQKEAAGHPRDPRERQASARSAAADCWWTA